MEQQVDEKLVSVLENAVEQALTKLFKEHRENYYYITLTTFGECVCPVISAWSVEALEREASKSKTPETERQYLKWDYASSPYYAFGYDEFFGEAVALYDVRTAELDDDDDVAYKNEMDIRLNCMEQAMRNLDKKGLFGQGEKRLGIVINAEYMPPDNDNVERAKRLNPEDALKEWLEVFREDDTHEDKNIDWNEIRNPDICKVILTKNIDDKRVCVRLRRDFASPLTLSDFIMCCNNIPFVIRSDFVYKKAKQIIDNNRDYEKIIRIDLTGNNK